MVCSKFRVITALGALSPCSQLCIRLSHHLLSLEVFPLALVWKPRWKYSLTHGKTVSDLEYLIDSQSSRDISCPIFQSCQESKVEITGSYS